MFYLLALLLIPLIICGGGALFFPQQITKKEFSLALVITILLAITGWFVAKWGALQDTEVWSGRITGKNKGTQKCCHCWQVCDSRDKDGRCTSSHEQCLHWQDHWWSLSSSLGKIPIQSCEPNSQRIPSEWKQAYIGEPAFQERSFTNYLLSDRESLLHRVADEKLLALVPQDGYPRVHSYYKVNKVLPLGVTLPPTWEDGLRELNADLGAKKQVDIVLVATVLQDPSFADAVEARWAYGPKNALIIVVGVSDETITWARVVTISRVEALKVEIRESLQGLSVKEASRGLALIRSTVEKRFKRTPMSEFEYLGRTAVPPTGWLIGLYLTTLLLSLGIVFFAWREDIL